MQFLHTIEVDINLLKVWDKGYKLFPEYSESQYKDLQDFVNIHGQPLPLVVSEDMRIVDGYNRYRLYLQAGINTVSVQVYSYKNEAEMEIHALALNAKRRHLDPVHCARVAQRLSFLYKPNPTETRQKLVEAGKKGGRGHKGSSTGGREVLSEKQSAIEKASKEVGVSKNTVRMVSKIDETKDKELIKAMEQGKISIGNAFKLSVLPEADRKEFLLQIIDESEKQFTKAKGMIQYLHGDCIDVMKTLPDKSVFTCITSPPYWGIKDFGGGKGQLGLEETVEEYVENIVKVFREVKRVLRDDGTLWLNMGDTYFFKSLVERRKKERLPLYASKEKHVVGTIRRNTNDIKVKDLVGLPWMVAFALRADGWYLRSDIIWQKTSLAPESSPDRPIRSHEYIFLLAKNKNYYYDRDSIRENSTVSNKRFFNDDSRNKRTVWTVDRSPVHGKHSATFPEKLIEPCVLAGCPEHGWVLDPFSGSGTTGIVSQRFNRNCTLIDINEKFVEMQKTRTKEQFFKSDKVDFAKVRKIIRQSK